jgi:hypothetical protein
VSGGALAYYVHLSFPMGNIFLLKFYYSTFFNALEEKKDFNKKKLEENE